MDVSADSNIRLKYEEYLSRAQKYLSKRNIKIAYNYHPLQKYYKIKTDTGIYQLQCTNNLWKDIHNPIKNIFFRNNSVDQKGFEIDLIGHMMPSLQDVNPSLHRWLLERGYVHQNGIYILEKYFPINFILDHDDILYIIPNETKNSLKKNGFGVSSHKFSDNPIFKGLILCEGKHAHIDSYGCFCMDSELKKQLSTRELVNKICASFGVVNLTHFYRNTTNEVFYKVRDRCKSIKIQRRRS